MVLENSSASTQADSFSDTAPSSDEDPYSSEGITANGIQYHFDLSALPRPIPIFGSLMGYNEDLFSKVLLAKINERRLVLQRPPTQDEATAMAYWTAKRISIFSYGAPLGVLGGLWRTWATIGTFRFPMFQPNPETFNATVWPHAKVALLRGNRAIIAWHGLRAFFYGSFGSYIGKALFGSYAMTVSAVGEASDPRLKELIKAIMQKNQRKQGALSPPSTAEASGGTERDRSDRDGGQHDDASPNGVYGSGAGFGDASIGAASYETRQSEGRYKNIPKTSEWQRKQESTGNEGQDAEDSQFTNFDDASPTGGQGVKADTGGQYESAWDRVRRGAQPGEQKTSSWSTSQGGPSRQSGESAWSKLQNNTQREQRQESTIGDSFTFSKTEEERSLAKSEAQKEFDARVEQERRGGEFDGKGPQRRW